MTSFNNIVVFYKTFSFRLSQLSCLNDCFYFIPFWCLYDRLISSNIHTVDTKTITPALRQTVTAFSTTNIRWTIFKRDSFNIKVHIVYKILALVLAIISLLDQQKNTFTFTASRSGGDSFHVHCVYLFYFIDMSTLW